MMLHAGRCALIFLEDLLEIFVSKINDSEVVTDPCHQDPDDMEPTAQPVPLGEQGMEIVKDDPQRRIARCGQEQEVHCAL